MFASFLGYVGVLLHMKKKEAIKLYKVKPLNNDEHEDENNYNIDFVLFVLLALAFMLFCIIYCSYIYFC